MRSTRPCIAGLIALVFALFALPASAAPEKIFSINVSPSTVAATDKYTVVIKNQTPNGNSSINSFKLLLPDGYAVESTDAGTSAPSAGNYPGTVSGPDGATVISISNMSPLKPQNNVTLTFWAKASGEGCVTSDWTAQAWTGSSFSGDTFRQLFSPIVAVNTKTTTQGTPSITIGNLSTNNPAANVSFTFPVTLSTGCATPPPSTAVSVTSPTTGGSCPATTNGATTCSVTFGAAGPATLTVFAANFGTASKTFTVWGGTLACGDEFGGDPVQSGQFGGQRGSENKDGSSCQAVGYTINNTILSNNTVAFAWNTGFGQQGAAFEYTMVWKPEYVNATTGTPERITTVQWTGLATPVPARSCVAPGLPAQNGTLDAALLPGQKITASDLTIKVAGGSPLQGKFPIVIGNERMLVTAVSGSDWTVVRGNGGTTPAEHLNGAKVMSTPLPIYVDNGDFPSLDGKVMQMCIVSEQWVSAPAGGTDTDCVVPDPGVGANPPRACVVFKTTIFDLGDGVVSRTGGGGN